MLVLGHLLASCNHTPVSNLERSFTFKVEKNTGESDPIKVDFLWIVDDSTSMCQEQNSLAQNFSRFTEALNSGFDFDPHLAVTTTNAACEPGGPTTSAGVFNTRPNRTFPVQCSESIRMPCATNEDCAGLDCEAYQSCASQGTWTCVTNNNTGACMVNPNGSVNTYCRRDCMGDPECQALFQDEGMSCRISPPQTGCIRSAGTDGCPDALPPILDSANADLFPCIASVGVASSGPCYRYEQPFRSALLSLDANGRNAEQAKAFLRDDAYLVVIFVSDEEDCSVSDGRTLSEDNYDDCGLLPTTDEGGPLIPVAHVVNKLKSLKGDPGKVIVAAIAGDSLASTPEERELERTAYIESKGSARTCYKQTSICTSKNGVADYGSRFRELTESFGPNGIFTNICNDEGIGPALDTIARTIVQVVNKICLPRPILDGLVVTRTRDGQTTVLPEGQGPGTYAIIRGAEDCAIDGVIMPAITFGEPPVPGEDINIQYQGDPQFD